MQDKTQTQLNQNFTLVKSQVQEINEKLNNLQAEEIIVNRITHNVGDRLEKKFSGRHLMALIILIVSNIGGLGIYLPQAEKSITENVEIQIEKEVEDQIDEEIEEQVEDKIDEQIDEQIDSVSIKSLPVPFTPTDDMFRPEIVQEPLDGNVAHSF